MDIECSEVRCGRIAFIPSGVNKEAPDFSRSDQQHCRAHVAPPAVRPGWVLTLARCKASAVPKGPVVHGFRGVRGYEYADLDRASLRAGTRFVGVRSFT